MVTRAKHIYAPKVGDEVKWPNGLRMTSADDGTIIITHVPEDDTPLLCSLDGAWALVVTQ